MTLQVVHSQHRAGDHAGQPAAGETVRPSPGRAMTTHRRDPDGAAEAEAALAAETARTARMSVLR